jgi:methionyl-tRNA formyltransferase
MTVLYITCAENGLWGIQLLEQSGIRVDEVVTIDPTTAEKFSVSGYADVRNYCSRGHIRVTVVEGYKFEISHLGERRYDIIVVNGWSRLINGEIISSARLGAIGLHAGHPPMGLGRAPLPWNIIKGRSDIEVYAFRLTENADDGNILARRTVEITCTDTIRTLYEKVAFAGAELIVQAIHKLRSGVLGDPQILEFAVHYPRRTAEDGEIDFRQSETELVNFVRAQSEPYPGAFAFLEGEKWRFDRLTFFDRFAYREVVRHPGKIVTVLPSGPVILTGGAPVWLTKATGPGGKALPDFEQMLQWVGRTFTSRSPVVKV